MPASVHPTNHQDCEKRLGQVKKTFATMPPNDYYDEDDDEEIEEEEEEVAPAPKRRQKKWKGKSDSTWLNPRAA